MVVTLIALILLVVFLAFFVGKNLSNVCTFWFFKTFEQLPVAILVFIAFAAGILVALLFFFVCKLKAPSEKERVREGVQNELQKMEKKNKKLKAKQGKETKTPGEKTLATSSETTIVEESKEKSK